MYKPLAKRAHVLKCGAAADALERLSVDEAALVNKARAALTPKKAAPRRLGPRRLPDAEAGAYQCVSPVPPASADGPDAARQRKDAARRVAPTPTLRVNAAMASTP